jgi:cyanophycin synthetase
VTAATDGAGRLRVLERSIYRGPHRFGGQAMVRCLLDLGSYADVRSTEIPGFTERLLVAVPTLRLHHCGRGHPGGFVERLDEGTLLGHVAEHVALAYQALAGDQVSRGKTRRAGKGDTRFHLLTGYESPSTALAALRLALELVNGMLPGDPPSVLGLALLHPPVDGFAELTALATKARLGPTTRSIAQAAARRRIPVERLDDRSLVRLGYGSRQRTFRASLTDRTTHLSVLVAGDKAMTKRVMVGAGVPVPTGAVCSSAGEVVRAARALRRPLVVKPVGGNHGRGVSLGLESDEQLRAAYAAAGVPRVIVEEQVEGTDYRILVIGGRVAAVAERRPASVLGDGVRTVARLIAQTNADPRRGNAHENVLTRITPDPRELERQSLTLDDVPAAGREVRLQGTANLSSGGVAVDRTDDIHPEIAHLAQRASAAVGLDVAGIDLLAADIAAPPSGQSLAVVEVNAAPGFRMHLAPSEGEPRDVGAALVDLLYPRGSRSRIPITAVTGTNGKSTVVRMIAAILEHSGQRVGMTNTSGVYSNGRLLKKVDASGPRSARMVLADPQIDAAVLETARGGIVREGLAFDRHEVGVMLNISADHLGLGGVETLRELARVKSVVVRAVRRRGTSVLNADDPRVRRMAKVAGGRVAYFTMGRRIPDLAGHMVACLEDDETLVIHDGGQRHELLRAAEIPATVDGAARFNVSNALAAALAAYAQGIRPEVIAAALRRFDGGFEQNPGRLNVERKHGFTAILDYGHNPEAIRALGALIERLRPTHGRVIGVISTPGDRRSGDIREVGRTAAEFFDDLVFRERPDGRGRGPGDVLRLLQEGAVEAGHTSIRVVADEAAAMDAAMRSAKPGDLVIMTCTDVDAVWQQIQEFQP